MKDCTSCYLLRGNPPIEVLLGFKKTGFGAGKYLGIGGKIMDGESINAAAVREVLEETGVNIDEKDLMQAGVITFIFPARPDWNLKVYMFLVWSWEGEPDESAEIRPQWFPISEIPYDKMWADARHWMPQMLAGKQTPTGFIYQPDNQTIQTINQESE